jgi:hypothetical protein
MKNRLLVSLLPVSLSYVWFSLKWNMLFVVTSMACYVLFSSGHVFLGFLVIFLFFVFFARDSRSLVRRGREALKNLLLRSNEEGSSSPPNRYYLGITFCVLMIVLFILLSIFGMRVLEILMTAMFGAVAIFCVVGGGRVVIYALRTGVMPTRRRTYDRKVHPVAYYGLCIFWVFMMALFSLLTVAGLRYVYVHLP